MSSSKALFFFLLSFILGVFISSFIDIPLFIIYELIALGIIYSIVFFKHKSIVIFSICLIFLSLGVFRVIIADDYSFTKNEVNKELRNVIYDDFSPPYSGILGALTIGDKASIPKEWKQKLNIAGVRHITAISGMHIIILSAMLLYLLILLGLNRFQAFYFVIILIWLFIMLIGFPASAVRAGIMATVFLIAQKLGRTKSGIRVVVLAASIMLLINPLMLRYDIGFQLSFLATLGLMYFYDSFKRVFKNDLIAITFAAQIFVLPMLMYNFGAFSLVSPITNLLIVPFLPILMGLGFIFIIFSLIWNPLGWIVSIVLWLLLRYVVLVVELFSKIPMAYMNIPLFVIPLYYICIGYIIRRMHMRRLIF